KKVEMYCNTHTAIYFSIIPVFLCPPTPIFMSVNYSGNPVVSEG
ncbi:unnamed protein product, partial [marine sediment metagenome]